MKWYWILLIVVVAIAIGFIAAKAMKPKTTVAGIKTGSPKLDTPTKVETVSDAATQKKIVVASK